MDSKIHGSFSCTSPSLVRNYAPKFFLFFFSISRLISSLLFFQGFIKDRASILKFLLAQSNGINSGHTNRNVALNEFTNLKAYSSDRLMHPKILGMDPTLEKIFPLGPQSSFSSADSIKSSIVVSKL